MLNRCYFQPAIISKVIFKNKGNERLSPLAPMPGRNLRPSRAERKNQAMPGAAQEKMPAQK